MKNYLLKVSVVFVISLLFLGGANAQNKHIIYLYNPNLVDSAYTNQPPEFRVRDAIFTNLPGYDVTMWSKTSIATCTPVQLDSLKNADLIIIGRGNGSFNFNQDSIRVIWNALTTPVFSMNMFAIRSSTLQWFETTDVNYGDARDTVTVKARFHDDPVFAGMTIGADSTLKLWSGAFNALTLPAGGSAKIMATVKVADVERVVYARFDPDVPGYTAAGVNNTPAGYRSFLGLGADKSGGYPFSYWGYTFAGQDIFFREIERLVGLPRPGVNRVNANTLVSASVFPNPAVNHLTVVMDNLNEVRILDVTGKLILSKVNIGNELFVNISDLKAGVYIVYAIDNNNNAAVQKFIKK